VNATRTDFRVVGDTDERDAFDPDIDAPDWHDGCRACGDATEGGLYCLRCASVRSLLRIYGTRDVMLRIRRLIDAGAVA
jgi:hypothetical protein